jgi:outer membrane protein TolC
MFCTWSGGSSSAAPAPSASLASSLSFLDVAELAATASPAVVEAERDLQEAQIALEIERAGLGLTATVSSDRSRPWRVESEAGGLDDVTWDFSTRVDVTKPLAPGYSVALSLNPLTLKKSAPDAETEFAYGMRLSTSIQLPRPTLAEPYAAIEEKEKVVRQKELNLFLVQLTEADAALKAFFELLKAEWDQKVALAELALENMELARIEQEAGVGRALPLERELAEKKVRAAEVAVSQAQSRLSADREGLFARLGLDPVGSGTVTLVPPQLLLDKYDSARLTERALTTRPEVGMKALALESAQTKLDSLLAPDSWTIAPFVGYQSQGFSWEYGVEVSRDPSAAGTFSGSVSQKLDGSWTSSITFSRNLPVLPQKSREDLDRQIAERSVASARKALEDTRLDIARRVLDLSMTLELKQVQLGMRQAEYELETVRFDNTVERFSGGHATELDVARSRVARLRAEANLMKAQYDCQYSALSLLLAAGCLDLRNGRNADD